MRGSKTLFLWLLRSGSSIVSIPQKACSALLRGFESRNRDWEPKNRIFVYNAEALGGKSSTCILEVLWGKINICQA